MLLASLTSNGVAFLALIISGITAYITLSIAQSNYHAVCEMKRQGDTLLKQTKASILQKCTENYIVTRRQRAKAIIEQSEELAKDYFRAICDLYWSEFHLYCEDLITEPVMEAWLEARKRDYANGEINKLKDSVGNTVTVKCSDVWKELVDDGYFLHKDHFVDFMELAHRDKVDEALQIKDTGSQT